MYRAMRSPSSAALVSMAFWPGRDIAGPSMHWMYRDAGRSTPQSASVSRDSNICAPAMLKWLRRPAVADASTRIENVSSYPGLWCLA